MSTKYIVNNLTGQTINGDLNVNGIIKENGLNIKSYKVYTALLTQSGGDDPQDGNGFTLTIGVTYEIIDNSGGADFTNVGAPNNELGTKFIATGTNPNWGNDVADLAYNTGAPVVTVLENTIGNIWFTYESTGNYKCHVSNNFPNNKSIGFVTRTNTIDPENIYLNIQDEILIMTSGTTNIWADSLLSNTPIEIRVYN